MFVIGGFIGWKCLPEAAINPFEYYFEWFPYSILTNNSFFYTADLVQILPDGNIAIHGRKSDMIKINGNRIEPAEIEAAIQSILSIDWCAVRGFVSDEQSFICAYYKDDISFDEADLRVQLQKRLPYYMIPVRTMLRTKWQS